MKKTIIILLTLLLVGLGLWTWKSRQNTTSFYGSKEYARCRKKSFTWEKIEYSLSSVKNSSFILKIEEKNRNSWTAGLKPMLASEIDKGYTTCSFEVFVLPTEKNISKSILKKAPKGVVVSIGSKKGGIYTPFAQMTLGIWIFSPVKSNESYDIDSLFQHIANSYHLVTQKDGTMWLVLKDELLVRGTEGKKYDYFIARLNGKEVEEKETDIISIEFISKDKGVNWSPVVVSQ